jgi:STE24 endopeptidase
MAATAFDPVQATNAYLASISAEEEANTNAYVDAGYRIMVIGIVLEIVVAFLLLHYGWSRRWSDWAERAVKWKFAQAFVYVPIYAVVTTLLLFPLSWYADFYTEHKYGLATQEFSAWVGEFLLATVIGIIGLSVFVAFLYLILRKTA